MFDYVMVDEYQDLSRMQIRLLKNIVGSGPKSARFYAAADDDQVIYGWRGSDVRATIDFDRHWKDPEIIQIRDNYRTPRAIFGHAAKLIRHNSERHNKSIRTAIDPDAMIKTIDRQTEAEEREAVMETIIAGHQRFDVPFERIAVLCRSNRQCQEYASYLSSKGLKVNLHESIKLGARPIKALIAWMYLSTKADNPLMYETIAAYPERYLPEAALIDHSARLQKRRNRNPDEKIGPVELLLEMHRNGKVMSGSKALAEKIIEVREFLATNPANPFAALSTKLGITEMAASSTEADDHQLPSFLRLADDMVAEIGLKGTLGSLTQLDLNAGKEGINVATMHGAKGLEYDIVALPGWEESEFPSYQRKTEQEISEERRLAYVAITRAKKMLIVSWSGKNGRGRKPSRFLVESGIIEPQGEE
jgi:DNA helicase-2/ATP-dependent DNA helicase PcrA